MALNSRYRRLIGFSALAIFLLAFPIASYGETLNYMYDEVNRLKRAEYDTGAVVEYTYDGVGNRLSVQSPDVAPPATIASPSGGIYNVSKSVVLSCSDASGAGCDRIYYTTNGTTPTASSSVYSSAISIASTTTLKFFAIDRDGNVEAVKTEAYTIDRTGPTGTMVINSGSPYIINVNVILTLSCSDTTGCSQMQFSNDGGISYSAAEPYGTTKAWTVTPGHDTKFVYARFKDGTDNWSSPITDTIFLDAILPTGTIVINSGATSTNNRTVQMAISCSDMGSGCAQMRFSSDNVTYSAASYYQPAAAWTLTAGDGTKTVYAQVQDLAGNWSLPFSCTIIYDTAAPATTASPAGGLYNSSRSVTLTCSDGSGSGCSKIYYTTNGTTPTTSSSVYSSPLTIAATTTLKYFGKDLAGNSEAVKTQTYTIDASAPTGSVYAFFSSDGLYKYNGLFTKITSTQPQGMVASGAVLYAYFTSDGLYKYDGTLAKITTSQPVSMVTSGGILYAFFASDGLYKYDGAWTKITSVQPDSMIASSAGLYAYFTADGLYKYDGSLTRITTGQPQNMIASGAVLYAFFASDGLYKYDGTWIRITTIQPVSMVTSSGNLYAFFSNDGLYKYDGSWTNITGTQPESMVASSTGLYAYLTADGLYKYDGSLTRITTGQPQNMVMSGPTLYTWFASDGLYRYEGSWTKITSVQPQSLVSANPDGEP